MGWTKRELINDAFDEIGIASYEFDLSPGEIQSALRKLDSLMASWNSLGIFVGYPLPSSPSTSSIDSQSGVPDVAYEAIITNLAIRIAPSFGKQVSVDTKIAARTSYNALLSLYANPVEMRFPRSLPAGAGNKPYNFGGYNPFINDTGNQVVTGQSSVLGI